VFFFLLLQPFLGIIHHSRFKKLKRRQIWSYLHMFNGGIAITVGIVNGGLGIYMGPESDTMKHVYIGLSTSMWGLWMLSAAWAGWRRRKSKYEAQPGPGVPLRKLPNFISQKTIP